MSEVISSIKNPKIKYLRKLYNNRKRKKEGKYILEGSRLIDTAVKMGAKINRVFITPEFADSESFNLFAHLPGDIFTFIREKLIHEIAATVNPEGIIAIADEPQYKNEKVLKNKPYILILDRIQDPGNMGTLIRTAAAAGFKGVIALKGSVDIYNLKVIRATAGAIFSIPVINNIDFTELKNFLEESTEKIQLVSTDIMGDMYYNKINYKLPLWLIIGNEANGISREILDISDLIVKIPLNNGVESLNAAVAGSIIMYNITTGKT